MKKGCTWPLALAALALITAAVTPAFGQLKLRPGPTEPTFSGACAGALVNTVNTTGTILAGDVVNITAKLTASVSGGTTTNTETVTSFGFDLACSSGSLFSTPGCTTEPGGNPVTWPAHTITTTCKDASNTAVTWSGPGAGSTGQITLTPSTPVFFPSDGSSCTVTFDVQVAGTAGAQTITEADGWSGVCTVDATTASGGATGSDFFGVDTCSVSLDKEVSCDGGKTWSDVGPYDNNTSSSQHCVGFDHPNIVIRYKVANTGSDGLTSCSIGDVKMGGNTEIFSGEPTGFTVAAGTTYDTNAVAANVTHDASNNPLTCTSTQAANEPNTATVTCTCSGTSPVVTTGATDSAFYSCSSCAVTVDKQISCDGGATWHDVGVGSADHCVGFTGDVISIRYVLHNSGSLSVNNCSITQDVSAGNNQVDCTTGINTAITTNGSIAAGGTFTTPATMEDATCTANSLLCNSTHTANEPNTATLVCSCVGAPTPTTTGATDTASFSCETCSVNIDKQVSCDGGTTIYDAECCTTTTPSDQPFGCSTNAGTCDPNNSTTQSTACIGTDAECSDGSVPTCTGTPPINCTCPAGAKVIPATNVLVNYFIENTGQDTVNCSGTGLGFHDTDLLIAPNSITTVAALDTSFTSLATQEISADVPCSAMFSASSTAEPDTATLACQCAALPGNTTVRTVNSQDTATFSCQQPGLSLTKECGAVATGSAAPVTVTASDIGDVELTNCVVTDLYANGNCPTAGTTDVTFTGATDPTAAFTLNPGKSQTFTGMTGALTVTACNNASIVCDIGTSAVTIGATASAQCNVASGCEGATPGFFKNHPENVDEVILADEGNSITSCGLNLTSVEPNADCSILNDLAVLGGIKNAFNIDPTYAQLVLQCVVAELNLDATTIDGGNCGTTVPGTNFMFDLCCGGVGSVCATGGTVGGVTISECQAAVGAFNADRPCLNPAACILNPSGPADSSQWKTVTTINDPTSSADCGGIRHWVFTTPKK